MTRRPCAGRLPSMASVKGVCIVILETGKGHIKHFAAWHDDDVQAGRDLMTPEDLPREPLGAISLDRDTQLPAGGDTQPGRCSPIRGNEQRHETPGYSNAG
jgi:hypothetical protein